MPIARMMPSIVKTRLPSVFLAGALLAMGGVAEPRNVQPPRPPAPPASGPPAAARPPASPAPVPTPAPLPPIVSGTAAFDAPPYTPTRDRSYHLERKVDARELRALGSRLVGLLEKLNRADAAHLPRLATVVVPDEPMVDDLDLSPLPLTWSWAIHFRKAVVVDQPAQVFGAYECGRLVRWGPVSSGRQKRPTPEGLFQLNWRERERTSTEDPTWHMTWYFNFESRRGLALHQLELPGYPASHACVRMLERDARWLYDWGDAGWDKRNAGRGTPVLVLGAYAFGEPPPWRSLEWLAQGVALPEDLPVSGGS